MKTRSKRHDGWQAIDDTTSIRIVNGAPLEVRSMAYDLDKAMDRAAAWWGAPLDHGEWDLPDDPTSQTEEASCYVRLLSDVYAEADHTPEPS